MFLITNWIKGIPLSRVEIKITNKAHSTCFGHKPWRKHGKGRKDTSNGTRNLAYPP
ncbi:hypothetical protein Hanom_Chr09g00825771 [Helianthus anomalus]